MIITICKKFNFSAAHRLHNPGWDDLKNQEVFGKCNNPNYHGHNYELIVKITGEVDPATGFAMDLKQLKEIVETAVIEKFDHKNLNLDTQEFKDLNPTAENISLVIYQLLLPKIKNNKKIAIILYETERNYVEYSET
ncbi:MAG: 6-carboxytetrahydropterin synthase [Mucilaginibacter sp.]